MDTRVWLLEKYFPLMLQAPLLLSVREKKKRTLIKTQMQKEERRKKCNTRLSIIKIKMKH